MDQPRKGECQGNQEKCRVQLGNSLKCPLFGNLGRPAKDGKRRVKGCKDPVAVGKRNRAKGDNKARKARKALGLVGVNSRHEEHWGGDFRCEVKAGVQIQPIETRFKLAEMQSQMSRPLGDIRPFVMVAMPDGVNDGIALMRLSTFGQIALLLRDLEAGNQPTQQDG
jgi:hypothetical protein